MLRLFVSPSASAGSLLAGILLLLVVFPVSLAVADPMPGHPETRPTLFPVPHEETVAHGTTDASGEGRDYWHHAWEWPTLAFGTRYHTAGYWRHHGRRLASSTVDFYAHLGLFDILDVEAATHWDLDNDQFIVEEITAQFRQPAGEFVTLNLGVEYGHYRERIVGAEETGPDGWPQRDETELFFRLDLQPLGLDRAVMSSFAVATRNGGGRRYIWDLYRLRPITIGLDDLAWEWRTDLRERRDLDDAQTLRHVIDLTGFLIPRRITYVHEDEFPGVGEDAVYWVFEWALRYHLTTGSRRLYPSAHGPVRPDIDVGRDVPISRLSLMLQIRAISRVCGTLETGWETIFTLQWTFF